MRTTEQRLAAFKKKTEDIRLERQRKQGLMIILSTAFICLMLITALSFSMPGVMGKLSKDTYNNPDLTASIFDFNDGLGYLLLALPAFVLGVCVTILSYRINLRNKEGEKEIKAREEEDKHGRID